MALDLLLQEAQGLSEDALMQVVRFMRFMKTESSEKIAKTASGAANERKAYRKAGAYKGRIWMADDFDAPLKEFGEYM